MKNITRLALFLTLLLAFAWPGTALARGLYEDKVVFGGTYTLESGEVLNGNLVILGGSATLESDSTVDGDVVLVGGTLQAGGQITGSIVGIGGLVSLEDNAVVEGNALVFGANLDRAPGAQVLGDVSTDLTGPLSFTFPGGVETPRIEVGFNPVVDFIWFMFRTFLWAALAVLVVLFMPRQVTTTANAAMRQPVVAGGLGLLTLVIAIPVIIVLTITIILIPASFLAVIAMLAAWGFGLIALGFEIGKRLEDLSNQTWAPAVTAGLGTFVLILVVNGARAVVPCVGWVFPALAGMLGLGAVLLTRFGTQFYPPAAVYPPAAPPAPAAPPEAIPPALGADLSGKTGGKTGGETSGDEPPPADSEADDSA